jgi:hypothetical protein
MGEVVKLGNHVLPVVPQKHARLRHKLSAADFQAIMSGNYGHETYRVLGVLIPALHEHVPEWEYEGYASEEAWKAGEYSEEGDNGPLTSEIVDAFEVALKVSGAGRLGKILDLVQMGQKAIQAQQAQQTSEQLTPTSPDLLGNNGDSTSTPTGTPVPTSTERTDSPGTESSSS